MAEVVVVGSGPSGAHAARTLVERGAKVTLLDVGITDERYAGAVPTGDFLALRREDPEQHRYLLGDDFEGIPWGAVRPGAQLTPPRQYVAHDVERWTPLVSETFKPLESLAYGGLGCAWGLGCFVFSDAELELAGLDATAMRAAYEVVAGRIGVAATRDDASPYALGDVANVQPPLQLDAVGRRLLAAYERRRALLRARGFALGQPPLGLLTQDLGHRRATAYQDMDFYSDAGEAAYRPWTTVNELRETPGLDYLAGRLVVEFAERPDGVDVTCIRTDTGEREIISARRLVLAAGALGTARIVLRSLGRDRRLPLLCNHFCYMPSVVPALLGSATERFKSSMVQLVLFHDRDGTHRDVAMASLYSYRSLMLFRIVKDAPLNFSDGRRLMRFLQSGLAIAGLHHPDAPGGTKYLELVADAARPTGDALRGGYELADAERERTRQRERQFITALRALGCFVIRRMYPGYGSSAHLGGTLPFSAEPRDLALAPDGRLHGTANVFVADGSGFRFLPAKGVTFTLMANAHRVASTVGRG